jgi:GINS complex subunit 3
VPRWYGERMRRKVQAGAGCESLRARCPYFYDVAGRLHALGAPASVAEFASATFSARYRARAPLLILGNVTYLEQSLL